LLAMLLDRGHRGTGKPLTSKMSMSSQRYIYPRKRLTSVPAQASMVARYTMSRSQHSILSKARGMRGLALVPAALVSCTCRKTKHIMKRPEQTIRTGTSEYQPHHILSEIDIHGVRHPLDSVCDEVNPNNNRKSEMPMSREPSQSNLLDLSWRGSAGTSQATVAQGQKKIRPPIR
jgi:hypothetical protein